MNIEHIKIENLIIPLCYFDFSISSNNYLGANYYYDIIIIYIF